jgi:hypothetical protein
MGYSLHVNERRHLPIIGVDTEKRELVSKFRNVAHRWESSPAAPLTTASVPTPMGVATGRAARPAIPSYL